MNHWLYTVGPVCWIDRKFVDVLRECDDSWQDRERGEDRYTLVFSFSFYITISMV